MLQREERKNLGYLGEDFQFKLVHTFLEDRNFFKDLHSIIDQNMFTNPTLKVVVGVMKEYYEREEIIPSYTMMKITLNSKAKTDSEREIYATVMDRIQETSSEGVNVIRDLAEKFFKQQNIIKTANEILRIAGNGDTTKYERCVELLTETLQKGIHEDLGCSVFDDLDETLSPDYRTTIPTGIGKIDEVLEGGLGKGELGVIIGSSSFGKAQPLDAKIVTPNGYKLMGEMEVGNEVIGRDGRPYKVSGVFPQGVRPIYKVSLSNGTSCECDIEHLWNVNTRYQRSGHKYIKGLSKSPNDKYYLKDDSYKTLTLREIMEKPLVYKNGKYNFRVPVPKAVEFNEREVQFDPYFIGYLIGDGNLDGLTISVGANDKEEVESILTPILGEDLHTHYQLDRNLWNFDIVGSTKKMIKESFEYKKSEDKSIPEEYIFNSIANRLALLQGLMDSDGCANKNGSCEFSSKSEKLALQVQYIVRSLGGFASIDVDSCSYYSHKYQKRIDCGMRYRVTISLCDDTMPLFRLKRKQSRVKYRTRNANMLYISNIEYVGEKEAQCIMVDSDEHLYLTEDFIVTHNTSLTTSLAAHAATHKCEANGNQGFKVLQIVFEDRIKQIQRKHLGKITGIEAKDLSKDNIIENVKEQLSHYDDKEMLNRNLRIKRFPSGEITASHIKAFVNKLINSGFKPDMVIVDYFECLEHQGDSSSDNWEKEGKTMRKFEALAGDLDMAIWIPVQGSRDSVHQELVTMDKAGGSFKKIQIAHIVISIARTMEDIDANKATIAILKNRAGKAGKVFNNVEFNNGTCRISTDNVDEYENMLSYNKNQQKELAKLQSEVFQRVREKKVSSF